MAVSKKLIKEIKEHYQTTKKPADYSCWQIFLIMLTSCAPESS